MSHNKKYKKSKNKQAVYSVAGFYDVVGGYHEIGSELEFKTIPKSISKNINMYHDITIQVAPRDEIRVFAKSKEAIDELLKIENDPKYFKGLFDCFSKYNERSNDYIVTTFDLEERKNNRRGNIGI